MTVGFRPTPADEEIIQAHKRPEESTSDVLRRALRALDRQKWENQARQDMERIAASGEDLSDEPDAWTYDQDGKPVAAGHHISHSSHVVAELDEQLVAFVAGNNATYEDPESKSRRVAGTAKFRSELAVQAGRGTWAAHMGPIAQQRLVRPEDESGLSHVYMEPFAIGHPVPPDKLPAQGEAGTSQPPSWRVALLLRTAARRAGKR
ncbi:hypothetical protein [Streptomyces sp. NPDC054901]